MIKLLERIVHTFQSHIRYEMLNCMQKSPKWSNAFWTTTKSYFQPAPRHEQYHFAAFSSAFGQQFTRNGVHFILAVTTRQEILLNKTSPRPAACVCNRMDESVRCSFMFSSSIKSSFKLWFDQFLEC